MGGGGCPQPPTPIPHYSPSLCGATPSPAAPRGELGGGDPPSHPGCGVRKGGFLYPQGGCKKKNPNKPTTKKPQQGRGGGSKGRCAPSPRTFAVASVLAALAVGSGICGGGALGAAALGVCEGVLWGVWVRSGKTRV